VTTSSWVPNRRVRPFPPPSLPLGHNPLRGRTQSPITASDRVVVGYVRPLGTLTSRKGL
ncbi:MAG: hypothetical protein QG622_3654, partial [Actinomycetota bacterium]|nr:hypothetical protein [Actinomycetota bacterium]